jgi:predicted ATPase
MARLDRLGAAREVAQISAAIGRDFSYALLGAVAGTLALREVRVSSAREYR